MNTPDSRLFIERFRRARAHFPEYRSALFWTLRDMAVAFPWSMTKLASFSMLGAALQGAALGGAVKYVQLLESGRAVRFVGITFGSGDGQSLLPAILVLFFMMSLSAWLLYQARNVIARLVADYQEHLLKRSLSLFGSVVPGQAAPKDAGEALNWISKTVVKDAQRMIMLARFLGQALTGLVTAGYAFPVIVYLDPLLTLMLLGLVVLFLPLFYRANIMAYKSNLMSQRSTAGANKTLLSLMEELKDFQCISPQQEKAINQSFRRGDLRERMNFLPVFLRSIALTDLWSNILLSLSVSLVIAVQVPAALAEESSWSLLLAYLVFLRLSVNSFKKLMSFLTKFSRFYPFIHRYQKFVLSAELKPDKQAKLVIKRSEQGISEYQASIEVQEPLLLCLLTEVPLSRYTFPYMVKLGTKADNGIFVSPQECFFIGSQGLPQRDGSLRSMFNFPQDITGDDLARIMPAELFQALKKAVGANLDRTVGQAGWERLSLEHRIELGLVAALLSPARVVILEQEMLLLIPRERRKSLLEQLQTEKKLTVIRYPEHCLQESFSWGQFQEKLCAVAGGTGNLLALGTPEWIESKREEILDLLAKERVALQQGLMGAAGSGEAYEDFDDD